MPKIKDKNSTTTDKIVSPKYLYVTSFIEGGSVMGVELLSVKMIAPYYGNSLYVWASVLGITLGGLAIGYFLGGIASKKYPQTKALFYVLLVSAITVFLMPMWGNIIMKMTLNLDLITATVISCAFFLLPPLVCFGMTSPIIINLLTEQVEDAGKVSGTVYGVSTIGGILMTFITGLYLLPQMGIKITTYIIAVLLLLIPVIYFIYSKKHIVAAILVPVILLLIGKASLSKTEYNSHLKLRDKSDGLLGQLLVIDDMKTEKRSLFINSISQTFMHLPTRRSQWQYVHRVALYASFMPANSKALICGLGGGNLVNEFKNLNFEVDAVELDGRMEILARKYFYMNPEVNTFVDDARHYIRTCKKQYDIVVLDMTAAENQPANVYTIEGFTEIYNLLSENGVMFVHYQNVLEGKHALAVKSIGKTLQKAGFQVRLINTQKDPKETGEQMFFATKQPIDLTNETFDRRDRFADPFNFPRGKEIFIANYDFTDGLILTDDKPIMDFLHINTLDMTRISSINVTIPILLKEKIELIE
ncbi:MAG: hypothetical protein COA57_06675 [Flavobacteriales bacterium]|nr:MAG: hypothetical protein COA57_06675 [Flavobacteriales bacterium]